MSTNTSTSTPPQTTRPTLYEYLIREKGNAVDTFSAFMRKDRNMDVAGYVYKSPKLIIAVEALQFLFFIYLLYFYSPFELGSTYPRLSSVVSLLVATLYVVFFYFLRDRVDVDVSPSSGPNSETQFVKQILMTFFYFVLSVGCIKGVIWYANNSKMANLVRGFISFLFLVGLLAIIYIILAPLIEAATKNNPTSQKVTYLTFLWKLLMYIPCLLLIFLDYMRRQFSITTRPIWLLLLLEFGLVAAFVITPIVLQKISTKDGIQLLKDPVYLNEEHKLGNFKTLHVDARQVDPDKRSVTLYDQTGVDVTTTLDKTFAYHYALSGWFYINPQPPNTSGAYTRYTPIINYANKPVIEYNGQLQSLRVRTETSAPDKCHGSNQPAKKRGGGALGPHDIDYDPVMVELFATTDVLYQKWNHVVINYEGGTMDVFLNGSLVGSSSGITPFLTYENITAGQDDGLQGGLCNIMYYNNPLTQGSIKMMYQLLRDKKNPVV